MNDENQFVTFSSDVAWPLSTPEKKVCVRCKGKGFNHIYDFEYENCWMCDGSGEYSEIK